MLRQLAAPANAHFMQALGNGQTRRLEQQFLHLVLQLLGEGLDLLDLRRVVLTRTVDLLLPVCARHVELCGHFGDLGVKAVDEVVNFADQDPVDVLGRVLVDGDDFADLIYDISSI